MKSTTKAILAIALVTAIAVPVAIAQTGGSDISARNEARNGAVLARFKLRDIDGREVELSDKRFEGRRMAICILSTASALSQDQAMQVKSAAANFDGAVVFVCMGDPIDVRAVAAKVALKDSLWLRGDSVMTSDFGRVYSELNNNLDRIPALVVVDAERKVQFASTGELTDEAVEAAMARKTGSNR